MLPNYPHYRAVDSKTLMNLGTKHSCDAYSYEYIVGTLKFYEEEGLPEPTLRSLISEDNIVEITEENAEEVTALINESFEAESNKQERERTMRIMRGEERAENND